MSFKHLFYLAAMLLPFSTTTVLASDSTHVDREIKIVKIGPQELDPLDLIDPAILYRLRVDKALKSRNKEVAALTTFQNAFTLKSQLANNVISPDVDLEQTLEVYRSSKNLSGQALILTTYGVQYGQKGEFEKAIASFHEALRIKALLKDKVGVAKMSDNLSILYKTIGKHDEAIAYAENSVKINLSLNRLADAGVAYLQLADIKFLQKKYTQAESYILKKCLVLFRRSGYRTGRMKSFQQLAQIYYLQNRLPEAKWFYLQADIMADKIGNRSAKIENLVNLAEVKYAMGDIEMAIADYKKAEILATERNYLVKLVQIKGGLGEIYHQMGNYNAAGTELEEYSRLRSNLFKTADL